MSQDLQQIIRLTPGLSVVAEAQDSTETLARLMVCALEVAVLDIDMPQLDAFAVVGAIRQHRPQVSFVFLTLHKDEDLFHEAMNIGVRGYIIKDSAVSDIVGGIRAVAAGGLFVSESISVYLNGAKFE